MEWDEYPSPTAKQYCGFITKYATMDWNAFPTESPVTVPCCAGRQGRKISRRFGTFRDALLCRCHQGLAKSAASTVRPECVPGRKFIYGLFRSTTNSRNGRQQDQSPSIIKDLGLRTISAEEDWKTTENITMDGNFILSDWNQPV